MPSVLIIGYGNTLRGDDGIGWRAAEELHARAGGEIAVLRRHQLAPELAEDLARARAVLFVDAAADGVPGRIRCVEVDPDVAADGFTHQLTPQNLLELTRQLYGCAPMACEISLSGASFELSEDLSPIVEAEMPRLIEFVIERARLLASAS